MVYADNGSWWRNKLYPRMHHFALHHPICNYRVDRLPRSKRSYASGSFLSLPKQTDSVCSHFPHRHIYQSHMNMYSMLIICLFVSDLIQSISGVTQAKWAAENRIYEGPACVIQGTIQTVSITEKSITPFNIFMTFSCNISDG